jgi:hypothetical protein
MLTSSSALYVKLSRALPKEVCGQAEEIRGGVSSSDRLRPPRLPYSRDIYHNGRLLLQRFSHICIR